MEIEELEKWMALADTLAQEAEKSEEVPVGAILVHDGKIVGEGANARVRKKRTTAHAEILALEDYNQKTGLWRVQPETTLFVTVEPCLMCTGALIWARVDAIYFGCEDPKNAGLRRLLPQIDAGVFDHRFKTVESGILAPIASQRMSGFFEKMRARNKLKPNTSESGPTSRQ